MARGSGPWKAVVEYQRAREQGMRTEKRHDHYLGRYTSTEPHLGRCNGMGRDHG